MPDVLNGGRRPSRASAMRSTVEAGGGGPPAVDGLVEELQEPGMSQVEARIRCFS
jgi:hypothetical protein